MIQDDKLNFKNKKVIIVDKIELPAGHHVGQINKDVKKKNRPKLQPPERPDRIKIVRKKQFIPIFPPKYNVQGEENKIKFLINLYQKLGEDGYVEKNKESSFIYTFSGIKQDDKYQEPVDWIRSMREFQAFLIIICNFQKGDKTISTYHERFLFNGKKREKLTDNLSQLINGNNIYLETMQNKIDNAYKTITKS